MSSELQPLPRLSAGWQSGVFQGHETVAEVHLLYKWRSASGFLHHIVTVLYMGDGVKQICNETEKEKKKTVIIVQINRLDVKHE